MKIQSTPTRFVAPIIVTVALISPAWAAQDLSSPASVEPTGTHLVLLGTGTPNADPERSGPAAAVVVDGNAYLVDAGPGLVRRAAAVAKNSHIPALEAERLHTVFLTHLHSDHTVGLPDLLYTPWVLGRDRALQVWGPPGTNEMMGHLQAAWSQDVSMRLFGLEPANDRGHRARVVEVDTTTEQVLLDNDELSIRAFWVPHGTWPKAYGYRFETPDLSVVISGDTAPSELLVEVATGCDILVHEVYSKTGFDNRESVWQDYHSSFHTSTVELAEIAARVRPRLLVLYHQLYWGSTDEDLIEEIRAAGYRGKVISGVDLQVFGQADLGERPPAAVPESVPTKDLPAPDALSLSAQ